jgi:ubiquinone/menaquinone biosynthesis C-methylase UbiE
MKANFEAESENLRNAWLRHPAGFLDSYLIQGVENPCFNPQSVVMRHLILDAMQPGLHRDLAEQEMLYSACVCATIAAAGRGTFDAFTAALEGEPKAETVFPLPQFLKDIRDQKTALPFTLRTVWQQVLNAILNSYSNFSSPFEPLWRERLASLKIERPTILEAACGSANDYRYFSRYGLDALCDYTGVDICGTNIANAKRRCPGGTFLEADALSLPFPDRSFDFFYVFDLFEHLSLGAFHRALSEAVRVTRRKLWLSFFQLEERAEHLEVPSPPYYLNILSVQKTCEELSRLGCTARIIDISGEWLRKFRGYQHYNPRARIIEATVRN